MSPERTNDGGRLVLPVRDSDEAAIARLYERLQAGDPAAICEALAFCRRRAVRLAFDLAEVASSAHFAALTAQPADRPGLMALVGEIEAFAALGVAEEMRKAIAVANRRP